MGIFDKLKKKSTDEKAPEKKAKASDAPKKEEKKPAKESKEKTAAPKAATPSAMAHHILLTPILTEKAFRLQQENKYIFKVATGTNKVEVKKAIKEVYGTAPHAVRIVNEKPTVKYRWGRKTGKTSAKKKAIITMPKGTVLNLTD